MKFNNNKKISFWKKRVHIIEAIFSDLIYAFPSTNYQERIFNYSEWDKFEIGIFEYYLNHKMKTINTVASFLNSNWTIDRVQKTTLAIILEAIVEYHYYHTPKKVLIEQAVITTQKYCENSDYKLVNAILDNYFKGL